MAKPTPKSLAVDLLEIIADDEERLDRIDKYIEGIQDEPYMPKNASDEYRMLAKRSISNWMPLVIGTPAQAMYVDGFRPSRSTGIAMDSDAPEWKHWQVSGLDARQHAIHRAALGYGHSFTVTEISKDGKVRTKGLSPLRTAALYEDAANDVAPYAALTIVKYPRHSGDKDIPGSARLWDGTNEYAVSFKSMLDAKDITVKKVRAHGAPECPVTRFAAVVDLEGRTVGVVEPMIPLQNRINQTVFDLLMAQTFSSTKVRYASGMVPPTMLVWYYNGQRTDEQPTLDSNGLPPDGWEQQEVAAPMDYNASRFLFSEDPDVKFGTLDESPLDGFIASIDMSIRHLASVSQTPPHHLLGQIANLSAEALQAAETALSRKVDEFRSAFGESWERVFRVAGAMAGDNEVFEDAAGEVVWRDMEQRSMAQMADALGKLAETLGIPVRGLWRRIPNVTQNELKEWEELWDEEDREGQMVDAMQRASLASASRRTTGNLEEKV